MLGILLIGEHCKFCRVFCWTRHPYKRSIFPTSRLQLSKTKQNTKTVLMWLAFPINTNQKPIGSAPALRAQCTLSPQPIYQTLLFNFSRVWFHTRYGKGLHSNNILDFIPVKRRTRNLVNACLISEHSVIKQDDHAMQPVELSFPFSIHGPHWTDSWLTDDIHTQCMTSLRPTIVRFAEEFIRRHQRLSGHFNRFLSYSSANLSARAESNFWKAQCGAWFLS